MINISAKKNLGEILSPCIYHTNIVEKDCNKSNFYLTKEDLTKKLLSTHWVKKCMGDIIATYKNQILLQRLQYITFLSK